MSAASDDRAALGPILEAAVAIARGAGEILRQGATEIAQQGGATLQFKTTDIDPVTEYDLRSERYIVDELRRHYPDQRIVGEEGGEYAAAPAAGSDAVWYIDPLDGTVNFAHGFPLYCVSIGLWLGERPALGVVYNPATDELYAAATGLGATRNGRPMRVSQTAALRGGLISTSFTYDTQTSDGNIRNFLGFQRAGQATRRIGSSALNLAYTATGQFDGHWELNTKPYDVAAGIVLVREAGGTVTDFDGGEDMLGTGRVVASNGLLHDQMLAVLREADDR